MFDREGFTVLSVIFHVRGHSRDNCFKLMRCDYCNLKGHLKENYYKLIGYLADLKGKKKGVVISGNLA